MRRIADRVSCALATALLAMGGGVWPAWAAETTQYTYDALGRVVSAIDTSGRKVAYSYDSAGNRTRVSNGAEFAEIIPSAFSASSNAGTTGLSAANGLRDGDFSGLASIHATQVEPNAWILADLGALKNVNHIEVAPAVAASVGAGPEDLNGAVVEYSTDGAAWTQAATVSGALPGAMRTISLGGVSLRYLRLRRSVSGQVAVGDLRLYSAAAAATPLIAEPDSITSGAGGVTFDPRVNDRDTAGETISIASVDDPPHGQAVVNAGVSVTYTPDPGYQGADGFTYTVTDGHDGASSAHVSVMVQSSTNHPPVAVADVAQVPDRPTAFANGVATLRPLANDYDPDGDALTITATTPPANGTVSVVGGGLVTYQPNVGFSGADNFTYTVSDGRGGTSTATVSVTASNSNPTAIDDSYTLPPDLPFRFDPRVNDSDANGDPLTITTVTQPANGTVTLNSDQTLTFGPISGYVGPDTLTYTISDGRGGQATANVNLNIAQAADPSALNDHVSVLANTPKTFDPRGNDVSAAGSLTLTSVSTPNHGAVVVNGGASVTYTPENGYTGADSFTYVVSSTAGSATGIVYLQVSSAPRSFTISPAVAGKSTWNLDVDGPLTLSTPGAWTITSSAPVLANVKVWGAGGGYSGSSAVYGGGGGFAGGALMLQPATSYTLTVGSPGGSIAPGGSGHGAAGAPGGGIGGEFAGAPPDDPDAWGDLTSGGGAGYSVVQVASGALLLVAGGGGGAANGSGGGAGGGPTGRNGSPRPNTQAIPGGGGTQGWGGAAGAGLHATAGASLQGGHGSDGLTSDDQGGGGGGGGGYFGGGGGNGGSGGGGGSSYIDPSQVSDGRLVAGVAGAPGQSSDPDRGNAGDGAHLQGTVIGAVAGRIIFN